MQTLILLGRVVKRCGGLQEAAKTRLGSLSFIYHVVMIHPCWWIVCRILVLLHDIGYPTVQLALLGELVSRLVAAQVMREGGRSMRTKGVIRPQLPQAHWGPVLSLHTQFILQSQPFMPTQCLVGLGVLLALNIMLLAAYFSTTNGAMTITCRVT